MTLVMTGLAKEIRLVVHPNLLLCRPFLVNPRCFSTSRKVLSTPTRKDTGPDTEYKDFLGELEKELENDERDVAREIRGPPLTSSQWAAHRNHYERHSKEQNQGHLQDALRPVSPEGFKVRRFVVRLVLEGGNPKSPHPPPPPIIPLRVRPPARPVPSRGNSESPNSPSPINPLRLSPVQPIPAERDSELPNSPLINPSYLRPVQRYRLPKRKPTAETVNDFSRQLNQNVYAHALATPVRQCVFTRARMPSFFLQDFTLIDHPETKKPWLLPVGLATELQDGEYEKQPGLSKTPFNHERLMMRLVLRKSVIETVSKMALKKHGLTKLIALSPHFERVPVNDLYWRPDMADMILRLMRQNVTLQLKWLARLFNGGLVESENHWDGLQEVMAGGEECSAVLWLGNPPPPPTSPEPTDESEPKSKSEAVEGPSYLTTMVYKQQVVPYYNLPRLLGPDTIKELRTFHPIFNNELVVVTRKWSTWDLLTFLWKLEGYLAYD
ncbi:MAG: hypothetical protein M1834_002306 [Cirrosporium novae-zelandiae]|nr:MAG: hypothetical protein M1834_002306 [Cirrosporium novae-zelandiae]